jgi:hypothetical protein
MADPFPLRIGVRTKFLHCFIASGLCRPVCTSGSCCIVEKLCSDPALAASWVAGMTGCARRTGNVADSGGARSGGRREIVVVRN